MHNCDVSKQLGTGPQKAVNGNSLSSEKAQHGYEITDTVTGNRAKVGISGATLDKNGTSRRANQQVNKWNKEPRNAGRYQANVAKPAHIELLQSTYQSVAVANDSVRAGVLCLLVIATDAPLAETHKSVHFETKKNDLTRAARLFGWVEFLDTHYVDVTTSTGQLLRIINVHLSAAASPAKRRKELELVWQDVPNHGPCIIAGN